MKGRSVKLREAHKSSGGACSILWSGDGGRVVTSSSADPSVSIHDASSPAAKPATVLRHHRDGVTALALRPDSASLASGSIDHSVKLYSFPSGEFQSNVTRFTLPIRSLAFNESGSLLAAAGDDDGIKLIATVDSSISRVLKGHKGSVTGLAFDPKNELLASVDEFGTVIYWELSTGKSLHTLKGIAPVCDSDASLLNVLNWSPDGGTLAVPGLRNNVVMYDRDTAEKLYTLKGDHEKPICFLSWSPNGKYMATAGLDNQILIWDIDQRQDIERQKFNDRICCLAWKPNGNALAVIDIMGKFGIWESVVPSCMKSPTDGASSLQARNMNGLHLFDDDDDEDDPKTASFGSLDEAVEESHDESVPVSRKRLRKQSLVDENFYEDGDEEEDLLRQIESHKGSSTKLRESSGVRTRREEHASSVKSPKSNMQEAFQPGSTPVQPGKRRFLVYNMLGSITTFDKNERESHIEVAFHDTGRGPRVPSMTDHFRFTMAALNEKGSVFANPRGENNTSTLMYRPFSSWANNSEWSMRFEAEEVKAVALGSGWVAAITNLNFLRIFTEGGLQRHVISLSSPVVTAAGLKDRLAVVTHALDCLPSENQMLEVTVFNISERTQTCKCSLPLTPGSCLTWFGFSEEGQLSTYDSKGILRMFSDQFGGSWLPLFSSTKARKSEDENYWVVGLNASKLFCIVCKSPDSYPSVMPKPVLTLLDLSIFLASSDLGADDLENEFIMKDLDLSLMQKKIEELAAAGMDNTTVDNEAFKLEAAMDACILKLIHSCCKGEKLARAIELAKLLSFDKAVKGALKLATEFKLPMLAEQFNRILEERLSGESKTALGAPSIASNGLAKSMPTSNINETVEPSSLPRPHFSKQHKVDEKVRTEGRTESCNDTSAAATARQGVNQVKVQQPTNPFSKASTNQERSEEKTKKERYSEPSKSTSAQKPKRGGNQITCEVTTTIEGISSTVASDRQCARPKNPFAKTSNNQDNSSLMDSIKKMKKAA